MNFLMKWWLKSPKRAFEHCEKYYCFNSGLQHKLKSIPRPQGKHDGDWSQCKNDGCGATFVSYGDEGGY